MGKNYLTVVYEMDEKTSVQGILEAHPWALCSHTHAVYELAATRLEIAKLKTQLEDVGTIGHVDHGKTTLTAAIASRMNSKAMELARVFWQQHTRADALSMSMDELHADVERVIRAARSAPAQPRDNAVFVVWWSDHMPNSTEADAWAEWCALRSNQPAAQAQDKERSMSEWFDSDNNIIVDTLPELMSAANTRQFGETKAETLTRFLMCEAFERRYVPEEALAFRLAAMIISRIETHPAAPAQDAQDDAVAQAVAAEREACAAACEAVKQRAEELAKSDFATREGKWVLGASASGAHNCMLAIRARGTNAN